MCGIFVMLETEGRTDARGIALAGARVLRHRGPDWSGLWANDTAVLAHERLAIVDVLHGAQPLLEVGGAGVLAVNGEIYNHQELRQRFGAERFATDSDCEVILPLNRERGAELVHELRGMFAFVLVDGDTGEWLIARDPIGIIPLYTGRDAHGTLYVASEMKALLACCTHVQEFPNGHVQTQSDPAPVRWYERSWQSFEAVPDAPIDPAELRDALVDAVKSHLMTDVPYGVLISGGLDSSIIAAIAARFAAERVEAGDHSPAWWPRLHSFSIGLHGSPDLAAARKVAAHLGTAHHELVYTFDEGLDALRDVIWHIESYDVTSIRASTPMYLMARRIKAMGVKMVLSGEGADELFGGYLYFHKAPDARQFHEETVRKLDRLHQFDCLRANKSMAAWGVEARVPFLDQEFLDVAMRLNPEAKRPTGGKMEKHILREAFEDMLPASVAWRQKEQFSDGVGYSWIDSLKAWAAAQVTDEQMASAAYRFPIHTPDTKEGYLYRTIFEQHFPHDACARTVPSGKSVACSTPEALAWDAAFEAAADPSGRAVAGVHVEAY